MSSGLHDPINLTYLHICFNILKDISWSHNLYALNRTEVEILLTIWDLREEAYLVAIRERINRVLGKSLTVGAIHIPLTRLEKAGIVESHFGEATPKRGGRRKRIYRITSLGIDVLKKYKKGRDKLWESFCESSCK